MSLNDMLSQMFASPTPPPAFPPTPYPLDNNLFPQVVITTASLLNILTTTQNYAKPFPKLPTLQNGSTKKVGAPGTPKMPLPPAHTGGLGFPSTGGGFAPVISPGLQSFPSNIPLSPDIPGLSPPQPNTGFLTLLPPNPNGGFLFPSNNDGIVSGGSGFVINPTPPPNQKSCIGGICGGSSINNAGNGGIGTMNVAGGQGFGDTQIPAADVPIDNFGGGDLWDIPTIAPTGPTVPPPTEDPNACIKRDNGPGVPKPEPTLPSGKADNSEYDEYRVWSLYERCPNAHVSWFLIISYVNSFLSSVLFIVAAVFLWKGANGLRQLSFVKQYVLISVVIDAVHIAARNAVQKLYMPIKGARIINSITITGWFKKYNPLVAFILQEVQYAASMASSLWFPMVSLGIIFGIRGSPKSKFVIPTFLVLWVVCEQADFHLRFRDTILSNYVFAAVPLFSLALTYLLYDTVASETFKKIESTRVIRVPDNIFWLSLVQTCMSIPYAVVWTIIIVTYKVAEGRVSSVNSYEGHLIFVVREMAKYFEALKSLVLIFTLRE